MANAKQLQKRERAAREKQNREVIIVGGNAEFGKNRTLRNFYFK
jgi:hypothetical protein